MKNRRETLAEGNSRMNVLIINPPIRLTDKPRNIPHGLAILANVLRKKNPCDVRFIDWNAHRFSEDRFRSLVKASACDVAMIGGLVPTYGYLIKISEIVKGYHPRAKVVAGGSAGMSVPDLLLKNSMVDVVCTGEGEQVVVELTQAYAQEDSPDLSTLEGITYKDLGGEIVTNPPRPLIEDLDAGSDLPAYDLLPMDIYLSNPVVGLGREIDFISGRGCPYHCTFCYQPWGHQNRRHSAEFLTEAILELKKTYDINFVSFQDDLFIADKKRLYEFCEMRNRFFPDIYWSCTGRANLCDDEMIAAIRTSGCTLVSYGFESGSPRMLRAMRKKITIDQMENVVRLNRKHGFPVPVSFILGMPGEDPQSCQETVDFCLRNNLTLDSLMYATPYPGTELFKFALESGRICKSSLHEFVLKLGDARDFVINLTDDFNDEELQSQYRHMITVTRSRYRPVSEEAMQRKIEDLYGPLSDKFFTLSPEDREHQAKHGAMGLF